MVEHIIRVSGHFWAVLIKSGTKGKVCIGLVSAERRIGRAENEDEKTQRIVQIPLVEWLMANLGA